MRAICRRWTTIWLCATAMTIASSRASAEAPSSSALSDPDTDAARRHFERGAELYDGGHYAEAVREFETAKRIKPVPAFEFNIARSYERLEEWGAAADSFARYLASLPAGKEADEIRARIAVLRTRVGGVAAAPTPVVVSAPAVAAVVSPPRTATVPQPIAVAPAPAPPAVAVVPQETLAPTPATGIPKSKTALWATLGAVGAAIIIAGVAVGVAQTIPNDSPDPGGYHTMPVTWP